MSSFTDKARLIIQDRTLRKRIIFLLAALFLFRVLAIIPIPGVNAAELSRFFSGNEFLGLLNIFSGGGLSNLSIIMLGVGPYITASIIMQLIRKKAMPAGKNSPNTADCLQCRWL